MTTETDSRWLSGENAPTRLRVGQRTNPLGVQDLAPDLSWEVPPGRTQLAYQLRAASNPLRLDAPDLWNSGRIASAQSVAVPYGGRATRARQSVVWQVRIWCAEQRPGAWSLPARWEMGLLCEQDWSARWIGHPAWEARRPGAAVPLFTKSFTAPGTVVAARLHLAALGVHHTVLNGRPISDAVLDQPYSSYPRRVLYSTYDVTDLIVAGRNVLTAEVGPGMAHVGMTPGRYQKLHRSDGPPRLLAQLEMATTLGRLTIGSDRTWRTALGATLLSDWYGGEDHDARRAPRAWSDAVEVAAPGPTTELSARIAPPIGIVQTVRPVAVSQPRPGVHVFDLGVNVAGWQRLRLAGRAGTVVVMRPGELLGPDGTVVQEPDGTGAPIWDRYILSGTGIEDWHPRFRYNGFRYLQVEGLPSTPEADTVTGIVLRAVNPHAGSFSCSNGLVNDLHRIIDRAIQSNMYSVLTDCPHREKLGWLEQAHLVFQPLTFGYDLAAYFRDLVRTVADAQTSDGLVPSIAPEFTVFDGGFRDDPNWGSAIALLPWLLYREYGDIRTMHATYPNMIRYQRYLARLSAGDLLNHGLGDWAAHDSNTPVGVTANYGYLRFVRTLADISRVIDHPGDHARWTALGERIEKAYNSEFQRFAEHTYGVGNQACDALALDLGIVPADHRAQVVGHFHQTIRDAGGRLTVGEIGLPAALRVLAKGGQHQTIWQILNAPGYPGYAHLLDGGRCTALPEFWDGPAGHGSQNHFMLGVIDEWFTAHLAGIRQSENSVAWRQITIAPTVVGDLTEVRAEHRCVRGVVRSHWTDDGRRFLLRVGIPGNATAQVRLPPFAAAEVDAPGPARRLDPVDARSRFEIGPGEWTFVVRHPGRAPMDERLAPT